MGRNFLEGLRSWEKIWRLRQDKSTSRVSQVAISMPLCLIVTTLAAGQNAPPAALNAESQKCSALVKLNLESAPGGPALITSAQPGNSREVSALGGGALPRDRAHRPNGDPRGTLPAHGAQARLQTAFGKFAPGMADVVVLNDPIPGQGSNTASKAATIYLQRIVERGRKPFDANWMQQTFGLFWDYTQWVVKWTNSLLTPPVPHVLELMGAASQIPRLASRDH